MDVSQRMPEEQETPGMAQTVRPVLTGLSSLSSKGQLLDRSLLWFPPGQQKKRLFINPRQRRLPEAVLMGQWLRDQLVHANPQDGNPFLC